MANLRNTDYNEVINKLQDYMLTGKKLIGFNLSENSHKSKILNNKNLETNGPYRKKQSFIYPEERDSLFWCFYIIKYGMDKYMEPKSTYFINEKTTKFNLIEDIRNNKQKMKGYKIKNLKETVENDLANTPVINMKTLIACCIAHDINIFYVHNRTYYELIINDISPTHVIHCLDSPKTHYGYEVDATEDKIQMYRDKLFQITNLDKPLKAMGSYKLNELVDMCQKLGFENKDEPLKGKKKQVLYEMLIMTLQ